jgi:hypothetical protein
MVNLKQLQALANNAKVELEMSNGTLGLIIMMGIFYIAITERRCLYIQQV